MTEEIFDRVYSLNVKVPYFFVAELAPLMAKKGKGAIVNLSTMAADYGAPGMSLYGSSKAAINLLTKVWAAEYGPSGQTQWVKGSSNSPPRHQPAVQLQRTKLLKPLSFWRRIVPVSFTAQNSPSTEGALPFEYYPCHRKI